ncbi:MAG TPA: transporter substrate-binding domain-containing protein [Bordetella sp.]|jgi:polar amino acid transport system substrate-binding protein|nr:transporter substrate-binding domain-containing protein [Bordetella sp.]
MRLSASYRAAGLLAAVCAFAAVAQADVLDDIAARGVVRVGIMTDYPPFGTVDKLMKPQGYDIDMSALLAKAWHVKVEFVPVTAPNRVATLQTGKADIMLNIGRSEDRAKVVDFTQPYAPYYIGIYGKPGSPAIHGLADLKGVTVAVTKGAIEERLLSEQVKDARLFRFDDNASTIAAFFSGQTGTMAIGNVIALALRQKGSPAFEEKLILLNSPVHAAVPKGEKRLLDKMNAFLSGIKADGSLNAISQKWMQQPLSADLLQAGAK